MMDMIKVPKLLPIIKCVLQNIIIQSLGLLSTWTMKTPRLVLLLTISAGVHSGDGGYREESPADTRLQFRADEEEQTQEEIDHHRLKPAAVKLIISAVAKRAKVNC